MSTSIGMWSLDGIPARSPECAALIDEVAQRIEAATNAIARQLIDRIVAEMPELEGLREELVEMAVAVVTLITAMTRSWTDPHVVPPPMVAVEWSRSLVARRLSVDVILRVYRHGQGGYHDIWHRELTAGDHDPVVVLEALRACSAFFFTWVDAITKPLMEVYGAEVAQRMRSVDEARSETVDHILGGGDIDVTSVSARLGYDLRRRHLAFIAWDDTGDSGGDVLTGVVRAVSAAVSGDGDDGPLVVRHTDHTAVGWLAEPVTDEASLQGLRAELEGSSGHVALGSVEAGLEGFRSSYDHARRAFRVGRLLRAGAPVTVYEDVAVADLLTRDVDTARQVTRSVLGPLAETDEGARRLLETLRVFFEEGQSFARAGRKLHLHQNTVAYRVRRAVELTGQDGPGSQALQAAVTMAPLLESEGTDGTHYGTALSFPQSDGPNFGV